MRSLFSFFFFFCCAVSVFSSVLFASHCGMDNMAIHVQSIRVCCASEDETSLSTLLHGKAQILWSTVT